MAVRNLRQVVTFKAAPHDVYHALMDAKTHATYTDGPAKIDSRPGGSFSISGGSLNGIVIDLEKDRRIVLAWRTDGWPEGHYSIASFRLSKVTGGTRLVFEQYGIPTFDFADIRSGWRQFYWEPMKAFLET